VLRKFIFQNSIPIFTLLIYIHAVCTSDGSVSVLEVGIGFSVFFPYFLKCSAFGIGISNTAISVSVFGIFPALHYFKSVRSLYVHGIRPQL